MLVGTAVCSVALVALLGALIFLIHADRERVKDTRTSVKRLSAEVRKMTTEQAKLDAVLRQPANAEVLERSLLLNTLVERKSISWTKIFSDLEGVMPINVRLISIRLPQITSQNEVVLDLQVGAQSPAPVVDFLRNLSKSPLFGAVDPKASQAPSQNEPLFRYRFTVNYAQKL